jgi:L-threonylcarbamoyladenylate synthase
MLKINEHDAIYNAISVPMPDTPAAYAQLLYAALRKLDELHMRLIFIEMPPDVPEWLAIRDRLIRASRPLQALPR